MRRITTLPALLVACLSFSLFTATVVNTAHAADSAIAQQPSATIAGKVTEVISAGGINYVEVDTGKEKVWGAGPSATTITTGENISFAAEMAMHDFHSKVLNRDFSVLYFVKAFVTDKAPAAAGDAQPQATIPASSVAAVMPVSITDGEIAAGGYLRDASLDGLNVDQKQLSSYRGKPLIINFWASWCPPCRAEMGSLEQLAQRYNGKDFNLIGISTDDYRDRAEAFLRQEGVTFENFIDHKLQLEKMLGVKTLPLTILVDGQGRVLKKVDGAREWDSPEIIAAIEQVFQITMQQ